MIKVTAEELKTTPKTILVLKKHYNECGHILADKAEIPPEMVNLTKEELEGKYASWKLENFTKDEVTFSKNVDSFCGEHYLVIEEEGEVLVYALDETGNKVLQSTTEIAYEYLPETDKIILKNGIYVYGVDELNKIREDYES